MTADALADRGSDHTMMKIQVGCGPHNLMEGWTNVDIRGFKGVDAVLDVTEEWPFTDVDFIYGEHFIEHLPVDAAVRFLLHAGQSLRDGGVIRLTTPNLKWVLRTHYRMDEGLTHQERMAQVLRTNRAFYGWGHQFLYDHAFLAALFESMHFADLCFPEYGVSSHSELQGIERHGGYSLGDGIPNLLIIEATRRGPIYADDSFLENINREFGRHVASGH